MLKNIIFYLSCSFALSGVCIIIIATAKYFIEKARKKEELLRRCESCKRCKSVKDTGYVTCIGISAFGNPCTDSWETPPSYCSLYEPKTK